MMKRLLTMVSCLAQLTFLNAQEAKKDCPVSFGLEYTTEMQSDFRAVNWVNQLHLSAEANLGKGLTIEAGGFSVAKTREERLLNDLQVFSNIEDDNLPFALCVLGLRWASRSEYDEGEPCTELFAGVHNMNEDYFTSPLTSLFTNSSCGIFPTISANYDIANYPLASVGINFKQHWRNWLFQASVYNGQGYNGFKKSDNPFLVRPAKDGLFGIAAINYDHDKSHYELGYAMHIIDNKAGSAPWLNVEQRLTDNLHILVQGSVNLTADPECKHYEALGLVAAFGETESGLILNHATFREAHEYAAELTCKIILTPQISLQPTLHLIRTGNSNNIASLLRMNITL